MGLCVLALLPEFPDPKALRAADTDVMPHIISQQAGIPSQRAQRSLLDRTGFAATCKRERRLIFAHSSQEKSQEKRRAHFYISKSDGSSVAGSSRSSSSPGGEGRILTVDTLERDSTRERLH